MTIKEAIDVSHLNSVKAVATVMEENKLPMISQAALISVGAMEGDRFKKALVAIANNSDPQDVSKNYVYRVTGLLTNPVIAGLASLGIENIPPSVLIKVGIEQAQEFRAKMSNAMKGDQFAKAWLVEALNKHMDRPAQASVPASPAPQASSQAPQAGQGSQPAPAPRAGAAPAPAAQRPVERPAPNRQQTSHGSNQPYPATAQPANEEGGGQYYSVHLYGKNYALCFQASAMKGDHSINLDAAKLFEGQRKVDWQNAIHFRFTERELFSLYACLIGLKNEITFSAHGPANDKSFTMKRQQPGFYASCMAKEMGARGVPFDLDEAVRVLALVTRQLLLNHPEHTPESLDRMVRAVMSPRLPVAA